MILYIYNHACLPPRKSFRRESLTFAKNTSSKSYKPDVAGGEQIEET